VFGPACAMALSQVRLSRGPLSAVILHPSSFSSAPPPLSPHKRPIKPRRFAVTGRVKEQTRAGRQTGQQKQIHSVGARQVGAMMNKKLLSNNANQLQHLIPCPHLQRQRQQDNHCQQRVGTHRAGDPVVHDRLAVCWNDPCQTIDIEISRRVAVPHASGSGRSGRYGSPTGDRWNRRSRR
jgi:hypothetical protein